MDGQTEINLRQLLLSRYSVLTITMGKYFNLDRKGWNGHTKAKNMNISAHPPQQILICLIYLHLKWHLGLKMVNFSSTKCIYGLCTNCHISPSQCSKNTRSLTDQQLDSTRWPKSMSEFCEHLQQPRHLWFLQNLQNIAQAPLVEHPAKTIGENSRNSTHGCFGKQSNSLRPFARDSQFKMITKIQMLKINTMVKTIFS